MTAWQNRPVSPTATDTYLYDGSGSRVEQQSVVSGTTSDTAYLLGGVEEVTGGVVTKYLGVAGLPQAIRVGTAGALNYLTSDGLGSVSEALDGAGNVVAAQLYTPYGEGMRSSSGTMPTDHGFTGQIADTTTGLDYYGARSYDPASQQFTSADTLMSGVNRYAYVGDNPTTNVDPTGHFSCAAEDCGLGSGQEGGDDIIFQDVMNSLDGDLTEYSDAADAYVRSLPLNEVTAPEASGPELVVNQGVLTAWRTGVAVTQPGAPSGNGMPDWVNQKGAQEAAIQARGQGTPPPPPPPTPPHNGVHTPPVTLGGAATGLGATFTGMRRRCVTPTCTVTPAWATTSTPLVRLAQERGQGASIPPRMAVQAADTTSTRRWPSP